MTTAEGMIVKSIINGRTYDTEKAIPLAEVEFVGASGEMLKETLFVNRRGAFFELSNAHEDPTLFNLDFPRIPGGLKKGKEYIVDRSFEEASQWAERKGATLLDDYDRYLGELPPEAGEEDTAMTIRLTVGLKTKLEKAARAHGSESLNAFVVDILGKAMDTSDM